MINYSVQVPSKIAVDGASFSKYISGQTRKGKCGAKTIVEFVCKCGKTHEKSGETILRSGAKCKDCALISGVKKSIESRKENIKLENSIMSSPELMKFFSRDLNTDVDPAYISRQSGIKYWLKCPECNHKWCDSFHGLKNCKYCVNQALCCDIDCETCFNKTLAAFYFTTINEYKCYLSQLIGNDTTTLQTDCKFLYDHSKNSDVLHSIFKGTRTKYFFICKECNHSDEIQVNHITGNQIKDCGYCSPTNAKRLCAFDKNCTQCYDKSFASHPKASCWDYRDGKNMGHSPYSVFKSGSYVADLICDICNHEFQSSCNSISTGFWCPYCPGQKRCDNTSCTMCTQRKLSSHPLCEFWHYELNEGIDPSDVSIGGKGKYWFHCKIKTHPPFQKSPGKVAIGQGCPICNGGIAYTKEEFIERATRVHGNKFNYELVNYINSHTKVQIMCNANGHEFLQSPGHHLNGNGCPKCNPRQHSYIAMSWIKYIECKTGYALQHAESLEGEFKIPNSRYKADGYCKETNSIFEFHGDFFHGNPYKYDQNEINKLTKKTMGELYNNTLLKKDYCLREGFTYYEIWENDWRRCIKAITCLQRKWLSLQKS